MWIAGLRDEWVRRDKPCQLCIVISAAIVVEAGLDIKLFASKPARGVGVAVIERNFAPGIIFRELLFDSVYIGDYIDPTEVVVVVEEFLLGIGRTC